MATTKRKRKIRVKKFHEQNGSCFYCNKPMYEAQVHKEDYESFYLKFKPMKKWSLAKKQGIKKYLICTIEHLKPKYFGGSDSQFNTVVAHMRCNSDRQNMCVWQHKANQGNKVDVFKDYQWCYGLYRSHLK